MDMRKESEKPEKKINPKEFKSKVEHIANRMEQERKQRPIISVAARMVPSAPGSHKLNVRIMVKVNDESFYCRQINLLYSAGIETSPENLGNGAYQKVNMESEDRVNYRILLANIPFDMTILYYFELMDKSGVSFNEMKDKETHAPFEFSTFNLGIKEESDWEDLELIKCDVCDYMCNKHWLECPGCHSSLHDTDQSIFADEQNTKERNLESLTSPYASSVGGSENDATYIPEALEECPSCHISVQHDWPECPICHTSLDKVHSTVKKANKTSNRDVL
jgi:hypothetical protein